MSGHIWDVKKFEDHTATQGRSAIFHALRSGADITLAMRFGGYYVERRRQSGSGYYVEDHHGIPRYETIVPWSLWQRASTTGHRYATGHNATNYLVAGCRMLVHAVRLHAKASEVVLTEQAERMLTELEYGDAEAYYGLHDALLDAGLGELHLTEPVNVGGKVKS